MDILDGKVLVRSLKLTKGEAAKFTTFQCEGLTVIKGTRHIKTSTFNVHLPFQAWIVWYPYAHFCLGIN